MKILYNWLKEFIDLNVSPEELIEIFENLGIEVEEFKELKKGLSNLKTGLIQSIKPHPKKPEYKIVQLKLKDGEIEVVSGSPGLETGKFVFVALPGTELIKGKVEPKEIAGVVSHGNIVSLEDLGLEENSESVFFPENVDLDTDPVKYLELDDYLYDLYITPNRPDLLGYLGIAIELAGYLKLKELYIPPYGIEEQEIDVPEIVIEDSKGCPRYTGRVILDVQVKESPYWLKRKLFLSGIRAISNIVDITNYVLLELGHPLHAFDLDKLEGGIIVRRALKGERILALDSREYELDEDVLVIADRKRPVAIAGVIGGEETAVDQSTKNILLESAYFEPSIVARTVFKYNLRTESSIRFMKRADHSIPPFASSRAAYLILKLAGGKVSKIRDIKAGELPQRKFIVRPKKISNLLGIEVSFEEIKELLDRLKFNYKTLEDKTFEVHVPSRRLDIEDEPDIAEEYLRFNGFDRIGTGIKFPDNHPGSLASTREDFIRHILFSQGLWDTVNVEFISQKEAEWFGEGPHIELENPLSSEYSVLRNTLLPGLLKAAAVNLRYGNRDVKLFEIGRVFFNKKPGNSEYPRDEKTFLGVVIGGMTERTWAYGQRKYDFYDIKGVFEVLTEIFEGNFELKLLTPPEEGFIYQVEILNNGRRIGKLGEISSKVKKFYEVRDDLFVLELDISNLKLKRAEFQEFSRYPSVFRDLSILVPENVPYREIEDSIRALNLPYLVGIRLVDVFQNPKLFGERVSYTLSFEFSAFDRTLSSGEVDRLMEKIMKAIEEKGYEIRSQGIRK